jgi:hypothetical protein
LIIDKTGAHVPSIPFVDVNGSVAVLLRLHKWLSLYRK